MATDRQIEANRRNAQKSTGPRSAAGLAISKMNRLQSGLYAQSLILKGEDPAEFEKLKSDFFTRWLPDGPEQVSILDSLIHDEWVLRRLRKVSANVSNAIDWDAPKNPRYDRQFFEFKLFLNRMDYLDRVQTRMGSLQRQIRQNTECLLRCKKVVGQFEQPITEVAGLPMPETTVQAPAPEPI